MGPLATVVHTVPVAQLQPTDQTASDQKHGTYVSNTEGGVHVSTAGHGRSLNTNTVSSLEHIGYDVSE